MAARTAFADTLDNVDDFGGVEPTDTELDELAELDLDDLSSDLDRWDEDSYSLEDDQNFIYGLLR